MYIYFALYFLFIFYLQYSTIPKQINLCHIGEQLSIVTLDIAPFTGWSAFLLCQQQETSLNIIILERMVLHVFTSENGNILIFSFPYLLNLINCKCCFHSLLLETAFIVFFVFFTLKKKPTIAIVLNYKQFLLIYFQNLVDYTECQCVNFLSQKQTKKSAFNQLTSTRSPCMSHFLLL